MRDDELHRLFVEELRKHRETLAAPDAPLEAKRRALHALKGAAGLIGEPVLADTIARLERRIREGDLTALPSAEKILESAEQALSRGEPAMKQTWPEPPMDLVASTVPEAVRPTYVSEMRDRLSRMDAALSSADPPEQVLAAILRDVHAMKGASATVQADAMAWFCHGLEARLKKGQGDPESAARALRDLASYRGVLGELIVDPAQALARLAQPAEIRPSAPSSGRIAALRRSTRPPPPEGETDDETLRVPTDALDRLVERAAHLGRVGAQFASSVEQERASARTLRELGTLLGEALRLIGPPRPWGTPAAAIARVERSAKLAALVADELDFASAATRDRAEALQTETAATSSELSKLRRTRVGWLLDRVRSAAESQARLASRSVRVIVTGAELQVDRRLLERLFDPVLQVALNAIAHGLESPEARLAAGKPPEGSLQLAASFASDKLRIVIEDDGAGVDVATVRARAVESGIVPAEVAEHADDDALLDLLFLPGFTTRAQADLLAGRGFGLDMALGALRRAGGAMRIGSRPGRGVTATLDVPLEGGLIAVVWVTSVGRVYAVPVRSVHRVTLPEDGERLPRLGRLLDGERELSDPPFVLELDAWITPEARVRVGVDAIGEIEDVALRAVSPLVASAGPYRGAVLRADGRLDLVLDAESLASVA